MSCANGGLGSESQAGSCTATSSPAASHWIQLTPYHCPGSGGCGSLQGQERITPQQTPIVSA